ncbi:hypothetical protein MHUMG1_05491 [Metarhizium humberi]|uniref:Uncharacterized protein n=1 Tax=Metarhizium humberi TaxID=2596975 RepID=A0A9P8M9T6_9HYPO|nr:hypothetical protein MHUMG1_05491 [Metarhizium humberi]
MDHGVNVKMMHSARYYSRVLLHQTQNDGLLPLPLPPSASTIRSIVRSMYSVVLACMEYGLWFLSSLTSEGQVRGPGSLGSLGLQGAPVESWAEGSLGKPRKGYHLLAQHQPSNNETLTHGAEQVGDEHKAPPWPSLPPHVAPPHRGTHQGGWGLAAQHQQWQKNVQSAMNSRGLWLCATLNAVGVMGAVLHWLETCRRRARESPDGPMWPWVICVGRRPDCPGAAGAQMKALGISSTTISFCVAGPWSPPTFNVLVKVAAASFVPAGDFEPSINQCLPPLLETPVPATASLGCAAFSGLSTGPSRLGAHTSALLLSLAACAAAWPDDSSPSDCGIFFSIDVVS